VTDWFMDSATSSAPDTEKHSATDTDDSLEAPHIVKQSSAATPQSSPAATHTEKHSATSSAATHATQTSMETRVQRYEELLEKRSKRWLKNVSSKRWLKRYFTSLLNKHTVAGKPKQLVDMLVGTFSKKLLERKKLQKLLAKMLNKKLYHEDLWNASGLVEFFTKEHLGILEEIRKKHTDCMKITGSTYVTQCDELDSEYKKLRRRLVQTPFTRITDNLRDLGCLECVCHEN